MTIKFKLKVNDEYEKKNEKFYLFGSFFDQVTLADHPDRHTKIHQASKDISDYSLHC